MTADEPCEREISTRPATASDASLIVRYVRALAAFENEPLENVLLDEAAVLEHGFGDTKRFEVIIAERDSNPVGMVLFIENFSTWAARPGIWVEELFVEEEHRRLGVGHALMAAVAELATERGCGRVELAVLNWNPAKDYYSRLGFSKLDEWHISRLDSTGSKQLADDRLQ